jgi:hypothetical protein
MVMVQVARMVNSSEVQVNPEEGDAVDEGTQRYDLVHHHRLVMLVQHNKAARPCRNSMQ